jgi:hypothetical protein
VSTIPNSGEGLFEAKGGVIKEGVVFALYHGPRYRGNLPTHLPTSDSIWEGPPCSDSGRGRWVVGDKSISYGPYANDSLDDSKVNAHIHYDSVRDRFVLKALCDIRAYEEIFIAYGAGFWYHHLHHAPYDAIMYNYRSGILNMLRDNNCRLVVDREGEGGVTCQIVPLDNLIKEKRPRKRLRRDADKSPLIITINRLVDEYVMTRLMTDDSEYEYGSSKLRCVRVGKARMYLTDKRFMRSVSKSKDKRIRKMLRKASAKIKKHRGWDNPTLAQAMKRSDWLK